MKIVSVHNHGFFVRFLIGCRKYSNKNIQSNTFHHFFAIKVQKVFQKARQMSLSFLFCSFFLSQENRTFYTTFLSFCQYIEVI